MECKNENWNRRLAFREKQEGVEERVHAVYCGCEITIMLY